jgi:hypothetical protein
LTKGRDRPNLASRLRDAEGFEAVKEDFSLWEKSAESEFGQYAPNRLFD